MGRKKDPVQDLIRILTDRGIRAELTTHNYTSAGVQVSLRGVNVFRSPEDRMPADTVWEPAPPIRFTWSWGPNFEYSRAGDMGMVNVANAVQNSLDIPTIAYIEREPPGG